MMLLHKISFSAAALALVGVAGAQGSNPSIYLDIGSLTPGMGDGPPSNTFAAAGPAAGEWNALDLDLATGVTYVTPPLVDADGNVTGVTAEYAGTTLNPISIFFDEPFTVGDDADLLDDCGYFAEPSSLTFTGLPAGTYDVLTYAMAPDDPTYLTNVIVAGSFDPPQDIGGDFSLGYAQGTTHAKHTVTLSAGQALRIDIDVAADYDSLNGVQIFPSQGGDLGTSYCGPAVPNSSGSPAAITVTGSEVAAANMMTLHCESMPINSFGFFVTSQTQNFVMNPGGSQGNLCVGGSIGRYVGPGQIQNSGQAGSIALPIDLTMVPGPMGFYAAQAGDTLNFQTWFRDSVTGMATSNFSDGREVVLQ